MISTTPISTFGTALSGLGHATQVLPTGTAPGQAVIDQAVAAARDKDAVVVATYNVTGVRKVSIAPSSVQLTRSIKNDLQRT